MLVKGNHLLGLKVYTIDSGKQIDNIKDIIYDPKENKVKAYLIDDGGWFSDAKVILQDDVQSIGSDAVMVQSSKVIKKASQVSSDVAHIAKNDNYLTKTKVITQDGNDLGSVSDILFEDNTGQVKEFEVSQGGIKNVASGKKRVKIADIVTIGKDATVVKAYTQEEFEKQGEDQGLKGAISDAKQKGKELTDQAKEKGQQLADQAQQKGQQLSQKAKDQYQETRSDLQSPQTQQQAKNIGQNFRQELLAILNQAEAKIRQLDDHLQQKIDQFISSNKAQETKQEAQQTARDIKQKSKDVVNQAKDEFDDLQRKIEKSNDK